MEEVPEHQINCLDSFYLPHHPVIKQDGSGKLRVVFNASQKDDPGRSLNDCLHTGPKLQEDILVIVVGWCFSRFVLTCDLLTIPTAP